MADALENLAAAAAQRTEGDEGDAEAAPGAKRKRSSKLEVAQRNVNSLEHQLEALKQKLLEFTGNPKASTESMKKKITAGQQKVAKCSGELDAKRAELKTITEAAEVAEAAASAKRQACRSGTSRRPRSSAPTRRR